jgi:hypothetical protein
MGSPADEPERYEHEVTLSRGFWLADEGRWAQFIHDHGDP